MQSVMLGGERAATVCRRLPPLDRVAWAREVGASRVAVFEERDRDPPEQTAGTYVKILDAPAARHTGHPSLACVVTIESWNQMEERTMDHFPSFSPTPAARAVEEMVPVAVVHRSTIQIWMQDKVDQAIGHNAADSDHDSRKEQSWAELYSQRKKRMEMNSS